MATTRTRTDLATAVLRDLGVIGAVDPVAPEDLLHCNGRYDEKMAELQDKGLVYWDPAAIPFVVFRAVTLIMIGAVAPAFQIPEPSFQDDDGKTVSASMKGLQDLRRHLARRPSGAAVVVDYY